jgi:AcrR family transcriptional regulator
MNTAPDSPNRFEKRRLRNRAAILEAAIGLFQRQGIRSTRLEEICERADIAPRTFFNHFETRERLYEAIGLQRAEQLAALFAASSESQRPFEQRLTSLLEQIGVYLAERPAYRELVAEMLHLRSEGGSELTRSRCLGRAAQDFVMTGVARGEVTRRHRPEVLADILLGALTTALTNWSVGEDYDLVAGLAEAAPALCDLFAPSAEVAGAPPTR